MSQGIGDTLRVSLAADPVEEVKVGFEILKSLELRHRGINVIACPTCGRVEIDVTIDDAKAYTKPWTVRINWRLGAEETLIEFICNENNRDVPHLK